MTEVVHVFGDLIVANGVAYMAQVAARPEGHMWEGWVEFKAVDGSDARRTPRETTQPDRDAVAYWATGLSPTYLEGAMHRAIEPAPRRYVEITPEPLFASPAPSPVTEVVAADRAVLDPFSVGEKGEELLRRELGALAGWHLRNIVRAYDLAPADLRLEHLSERELIELIVAAVQPV